MAFNGPVRHDNEPIGHFGARLLRFFIEHDGPSGCYEFGHYDVEDLRIAHYAAHRALAQRVTLTVGDEQTETSPAVVYDRIESIRRQLTRSIKTFADTRDATVQALFDSVYPKGGRDGYGPRVLVTDITPDPKLPPTTDALPTPAAAISDRVPDRARRVTAAVCADPF